MAEDTHTVIQLLEEGFRKAAWHGPNLLGSLRGVDLPRLLFRPTRDGHNIWELAVHCAYWKYAVRNRLMRGKRNSFPLEGSNFFPRNEGLTLEDWRKDLALLKREHALLEAAVAGLPPSSFARKAKGSRHTVRRIVLGVAAHDIYHAGQISLLKRMAGRGDS